MSEIEPVHQIKDGTWWFWDEMGLGRFGPFEDEKTARTVLGYYCHWLDTGEQIDPEYNERGIIYDDNIG